MCRGEVRGTFIVSNLEWKGLLFVRGLHREDVAELLGVELGGAVVVVDAVLFLFDIGELRVAEASDALDVGNLRDLFFEDGEEFIFGFDFVAVAPCVVGVAPFRWDPGETAEFIEHIGLAIVDVVGDVLPMPRPARALFIHRPGFAFGLIKNAEVFATGVVMNGPDIGHRMEVA